MKRIFAIIAVVLLITSSARADDGWAHRLQDASDVDKTSPADNQALVWSDTSQLWIPSDVSITETDPIFSAWLAATPPIYTETDPLSWSKATNQTGLTGDKTGTFALTTTGAIGGGAITGTSFVIGANTLTTSEWAFLDGQDQSVFTTSNVTHNSLAIPTTSWLGLASDKGRFEFNDLALDDIRVLTSSFSSTDKTYGQTQLYQGRLFVDWYQSTNTIQPTLYLRKSDNTAFTWPPTLSATDDGEYLGQIYFQGASGSAFATAAQIRAVQNGSTVGVGDLIFETCYWNAAALTRANQLKLINTGDISMQLGDTAGATKFSVNDSTPTEVASIDSNGLITGANATITSFTTAGFVKNAVTTGVLSGGNSIALADISSLISGSTPITFTAATGVISHDTTNGYVHVPANGAATQLLQYSSAGTAKWITLSADASIADGGAIAVADDSHAHTITTVPLTLDNVCDTGNTTNQIITVQDVILTGRVSDPTPTNGQIWYRSDLNQIRLQLNSKVFELVLRGID